MYELARDYISHIDDVLGRIVFKNNCGLTGNFSGKICYRISKKAYNKEEEQLSVINYLEYNYDEQFIDDFREKALEHLYDSDQSIVATHEGEDYKRMLRSPFFNFEDNLPSIANFFPDKVKHELSSYMGSYFKVVNAQVLEIEHRDAGVEEFDMKSTVQFHSDPYASDVFRYFVFLDDVTEEDGPTEVVDRETTRDLMTESSYSRIRRQRNMKDVHRLVGGKGESALFDVSNNVHRAGNPKEGRSRILIMFVLIPTTEPMSDSWFNNSANYSMKESRFSGLRRLWL